MTTESRIAMIRECGYHERVPMFARRVEPNVYAILHESGESVTRIDSSVHPVGSPLGARYEHPGGIHLTRRDCISVGFRFGHPNR